MVLSRPNCGFSYIELLVSTAIIGICYLIYLGPGSHGYEIRARAKCASNLQQLHLSLALYAQEHDGWFPRTEGATSSEAPLSLLVPQYTTDTSLFICPAGKDSRLPAAKPFDDRRISYAYYMGVRQDDSAAETPLISDSQLNAEPKLAGDRVFFEKHVSPGGNHRAFGGNILYADGHVETLESSAATRSLVPRPGVTLLNPKP